MEMKRTIYNGNLLGLRRELRRVMKNLTYPHLFLPLFFLLSSIAAVAGEPSQGTQLSPFPGESHASFSRRWAAIHNKDLYANGKNPGLSAHSIRRNFSGTFFHVNPAGTYLITKDDPGVGPATSIPLSAIGSNIQAGSIIALQQAGGISNGVGGPDDEWHMMIAVFVDGNGNFLSPGSQTTAPSIVTQPTYHGGIPTDIPQDFGLNVDNSSAPPTYYAQVPQGAVALLVCASDSAYGDNTDPNGNFGVFAEPVLFPNFNLSNVQVAQTIFNPEFTGDGILDLVTGKNFAVLANLKATNFLPSMSTTPVSVIAVVKDGLGNSVATTNGIIAATGSPDKSAITLGDLATSASLKFLFTSQRNKLLSITGFYKIYVEASIPSMGIIFDSSATNVSFQTNAQLSLKFTKFDSPVECAGSTCYPPSDATAASVLINQSGNFIEEVFPVSSQSSSTPGVAYQEDPFNYSSAFLNTTPKGVKDVVGVARDLQYLCTSNFAKSKGSVVPRVIGIVSSGYFPYHGENNSGITYRGTCSVIADETQWLTPAHELGHAIGLLSDSYTAVTDASGDTYGVYAGPKGLTGYNTKTELSIPATDASCGGLSNPSSSIMDIMGPSNEDDTSCYWLSRFSAQSLWTHIHSPTPPNLVQVVAGTVSTVPSLVSSGPSIQFEPQSFYTGTAAPSTSGSGPLSFASMGAAGIVTDVSQFDPTPIEIASRIPSVVQISPGVPVSIPFAAILGNSPETTVMQISYTGSRSSAADTSMLISPQAEQIKAVIGNLPDAAFSGNLGLRQSLLSVASQFEGQMLANDFTGASNTLSLLSAQVSSGVSSSPTNDPYETNLEDVTKLISTVTSGVQNLPTAPRGNGLFKVASDKVSYAPTDRALVTTEIVIAPSDPKFRYLFLATLDGHTQSVEFKNGVWTSRLPTLSAGNHSYIVTALLENSVEMTRLNRAVFAIRQQLIDIEFKLSNETDPIEQATLRNQLNTKTSEIYGLNSQILRERRSIGASVHVNIQVH